MPRASPGTGSPSETAVTGTSVCRPMSLDTFELKGVFSETTLAHGHAIDIMDAAPRDAAHLGKGGNEVQALVPARPPRGGKLRPDVSPKGRVRLLDHASDALPPRAPHERCHALCSRRGVKVPRLGIDAEHRGLDLGKEGLRPLGRRRHDNVRRQQARARVERVIEPLPSLRPWWFFSPRASCPSGPENRYIMKRLFLS